jgi:uncharacterized protein
MALFFFLILLSPHPLSFSSSTALCLDIPPLRGHVNDYARMMSGAASESLEKELRSFEQSDSTQLVVLTVPSLEGEVLEDFSMKVAEAWKIGQKGKDNGIILVVANKEHKIRVEVGRGLEGRLTDLMAGRIIDLVIKPRFKRADFDGGFTAGIHALIDATRGEFKANDGAQKPRVRTHLPLPALIIFGGIALLIVGNISRTAGAVAGTVGLPLLAYLTIAPVGLVLLFILGAAGLGLGILLPLLSHNHGGIFWGGGGGGWGSSGGGGDSGGGFSGGGGDFGGGGSSGDW